MKRIIFIVLLASLLVGCFKYSPLCYPIRKKHQNSIRQIGTIEQLPNAIVGKPYSAYISSGSLGLFMITFAPGDMGLTWSQKEAPVEYYKNGMKKPPCNDVTIYGVPTKKGVITIYARNSGTVHTGDLCPNYSIGFRQTYKIIVTEE